MSDDTSLNVDGPGQRRRWFYISIGLVMIGLGFAGFSPSVLDPSGRNGPMTPLVIAHGALLAAWLWLFVAQATLVATGRTSLHRRTGVFGGVLALLAIVVGYVAIVTMLRRGYDLSGDIARGAGPPGTPRPGINESWIPFGEFFVFGLLVTAGLLYRHRTEIHRRLMVLAVASLALEPIFHGVGYISGQWPAAWLAATIAGTGLQLLLLFASAIHDRWTEGRIHPVSLWVPASVIASMILFATVVSTTTAWRDLAAWLVNG